MIIPPFKTIFIGEVLYHEIGHHIHAMQQPGYRKEKEAFADEWRDKLMKTFMNRRYWYLRGVLKLFEPLLRRLYSMKNLARIVIFVSFISLCACARDKNASPEVGSLAGSPLPTPVVQASVAPTPDTPIRKIDFHNFTYASYLIGGKPFTLKDGRYAGVIADGATEPYPVSLIDSIYRDVTGDGAEDAMLVLSESVRGSAILYYVYVYGIDRNKPKLLWFFETGDRAQGGLRRVFGENGKLVVELYGKDTYLGGDIFGGSPSACCPSYYTRSRYEWKGNRFQRIQQLEVFSIEGGAPYIK